MAKHTPDLFNSRSATQDFLFSHTEDTSDEGGTASETMDRESPFTPTPDHLSDMLDRQGLLDAIGTRMGSADHLCAIAVGIKRAADKPLEQGEQKDLPPDAATPLALFGRSHGGIWGRIGRDRFACVFSDPGADNGRDLAEALLSAFSESETLRITIGLAVYPTIDYARSQIVENAEKALAHGTFFGPGTITAFDAVSLNISGDHRYQAGDIQGAIDEFTKGLSIDPQDANLHNSLGVCHGVLKDYDSALAAFENAERLAPDEVMPIYNKGYVLLLQGCREEALACFLDADAREANIFEVVFHIGQIYMEMDAPDEARPYLTAATRANTRSGPAFKSLGACLDKLGLTKEAIGAYKSTVKINPDDAEALSNLGRLYTMRGESLDVALVFCEQSIRLAPENGLYRHRLAMVYLNQGKLDDALSAFEAAVTRGHDSHSQIEETRNRMLAAKAS